ncbi:MAG TPA: hypothetical protein VFH43_13825 [Candidatus Kapabacteria bacterium]|jgi:uncharacterized membrane protein|nr:hypothetical protein [Candidatus Kapabacteria bacterium]
MDQTHIHLFLNHAPVAGVAFGLFFLAIGLIKKSQGMRLSAITLFTISSLLVLPVFFTGESAEETAEGLPGVSESIIETHEDAAKAALAGMIVLGVASIVTLSIFAKKHLIPKSMLSAVGVLAVLAMVLIGRTAYLGGQIRHSEVRSGAVPAGQEATGEQQGAEDDD